MKEFVGALKTKKFQGEIDASEATRELYSHDASLFELKPQLVVYPKNVADLQKLVAVTNELRKKDLSLSLTARGGGTCMSGGSINESVIVDVNRHFAKIEAVSEYAAHVQPGVFYRDFEKQTIKRGGLLPCFPASREICTVGGMVANNSGGEKSLQFGKTENFVSELEVILADGNKYVLKPLNKRELVAKMGQKDFEGRIYSQMFRLLEDNYDDIKAA